MFAMGIGMISGYRPESAVTWSWNEYGQYCSQPTDNTKGSPADIVPQVWLGTPEAGLRIALKGPDPEWNSPEDYPKVPTASAFANCRPDPNAAAPHALCAGTVSLRSWSPASCCTRPRSARLSSNRTPPSRSTLTRSRRRSRR